MTVATLAGLWLTLSIMREDDPACVPGVDDVLLPLEGFAREIEAIADRVRKFLLQYPQLVHRPPANQSGTALGRLARRLIVERRERERAFGEGIFADPAWDILLDLFVALEERRRVSVSSLCIAAAVPPTTALRWIASLERDGMLIRQSDPDDRRRTWMTLSAPTAGTMRELLNSWEMKSFRLPG